VTGFVSVDSTNRNIVISFRGSHSVRNWLADVDFTAIPTDLCNGCTVHQGFWRSWLEARTGILAAAKSAVAKNPGFSIIATGHSLGGAIATLCAANLRNSGYTVALVRGSLSDIYVGC
jgi:predicted lipase